MFGPRLLLLCGQSDAESRRAKLAKKDTQEVRSCDLARTWLMSQGRNLSFCLALDARRNSKSCEDQTSSTMSAPSSADGSVLGWTDGASGAPSLAELGGAAPCEAAHVHAPWDPRRVGTAGGRDRKTSTSCGRGAPHLRALHECTRRWLLKRRHTFTQS